ncbi:MAG: hypothetical protein V5A13_01495 [Haloarculaceae archaeon]
MDDYESESSPDPLEATAYLTRSEYRLRLLEALREGPHSRRDLVDATNASSATVGRVVNELQSRGWAERTTDGYVTTPSGTQIVNEVQPFIGSMATILTLGDPIEWIPTDELTIGLHQFEDATVRRADRNDPAEAAEFLIELIEETSTFRVLTHLVSIPAVEEVLRDGVQCGQMSLSVVITDDVCEYLYDHPDHRSRWKEIAEAGAKIYRHDARIPCNLWICDDVMLLAESHSDEGNPYDVLVIKNPPVLSWARELVAQYERESKSVAADFFTTETTI